MTIAGWRIALVVAGAFVIGIGGVALVAQVPPGKYLGILIWFAGALVLHDGILAPIVFGVSLLLRRAGKRIPFVVIAIVQAALVVAALFTALVVPEMLEQGIGTANSSLLPLEYGRNLVLFYAGLVVATGLGIGGYLVVARRQKLRSPSVQD